MTGRLSDRPMILAASIPHLGQTTPTAALGLRAIRSLLTHLDASRPQTVLDMPLISGKRGDSEPGVGKYVAFPRKSSHIAGVRGQARPYICGYDDRPGDISVTLRSSPFPLWRAYSNTLVYTPSNIDVIVRTGTRDRSNRVRISDETRA